MNSIYFKNFCTTATLVLLCFLFLGASFTLLGRSFVIDANQEGLNTCAQETVRTARAFGDGDLTSWDLRMNLSAMARITGDHIFLTNAEGWVVSCSDTDLSCGHIGQCIDPSVLATAESAGKYSQLTTLGGFYAAPHYVVAMPIQGDNGAVAGFAFVSANSSEIIGVWSTFIVTLLLAAGGILLFAMFFTLYASKRQAKPLNEMATAARRFAHGDFSVRVEDDGREDEVGELTRSFNAMADAMEQSEMLRRDFIANVSHELKTPMTTIAGFADGILDGTIPAEEQSRYLTTISTETKRLNRLVRRMLDMSRIQRQDPQVLKSKSFDICEVIVTTMLNFEKKINDKHLQVDLQVPESAIYVLGDGDAITQVVYNLLDNAVKFSPEGETLHVGLWKQGGRAFVSVRNRGDTIPPEELPLIFDRFHKTDRSRSRDRDGVGLGLYIVKTILDNHDQDINVTSENGVTEFTFTLELRPAKAEKAPKQDKSGKTDKPSGKGDKSPKQDKSPKG